ncbi:MAG TPA: hypothetical protein ENI99_03365 [Sedimenticola sp.]|nr:hypothetical protein [Sedimenticola sp.]
MASVAQLLKDKSDSISLVSRTLVKETIIGEFGILSNGDQRHNYGYTCSLADKADRLASDKLFSDISSARLAISLLSRDIDRVSSSFTSRKGCSRFGAFIFFAAQLFGDIRLVSLNV